MALNGLEKMDKPIIRTPDQRLRVFISSTLQELSHERTAVRQAINQLHLIPVCFESGARPHPPQDLYRAYLSQSHIFIGIYWQSYGWVAPDMLVSGLEDEYHLSKNMPRLIYIKSPAQDRDPKLADLLSQIKSEEKICYKYFSTPEELQELVTADLILLLTEQFERSQANQGFLNESGEAKRTNLPTELTQFVGREQQVVTISELLQQDYIHLVTLSGPGGVGKTRLALKAASGLVSYFPDGVWLIELAPLMDPTLLLTLIAETLSVREEASRPLIKTLSDYFAGKEILIILDNCEHLIHDITHTTAQILGISEGIKILATSREPLGITGEIVWSIPPLSNPQVSDGSDLENFIKFESVKLFVNRAIASKSDFTLTQQNASALAKILSHLDGIPLAIELAAARVRILSIEEIALRLEDSFKFLVGSRTANPRQQTLDALIEWSYVLLSEKERILFHRLSIFSGGWSLQAAEEICAGGTIDSFEVLDLLCSLVDKSLVIADIQDCCERYKFLETIRQFSQDRFDDSENKNEYLKKHAEYYMMLAESSYGELWGIKQGGRLCQLATEIDNFRIAFAWLSSLERDEVYLLRIAGSLWHFWEIEGLISEGRTWLEHALAKNPNASPYLRANGLRGLANLVRLQGDYGKAIEYHRQSLALFIELDFKMSIARELNDLGEIEWLQGNYDRAVDLHTKSLNLRRKIDDIEGIAVSLEHLGSIARDRGQYQNAKEFLGKSLKLFRQLGDKRFTGNALKSLGMIEAVQSEYSSALAYYEEALNSYREINDKLGISNIFYLLGEVAKDQGDFIEAKKHYDRCQSMKQEIGDKRGIAQAISGLAEVAILQGRYNEGENLARESLGQFRKLGVKRGIVVSYELLAYANHYLGKFNRANSFATRGLKIAKDINAPRAIAYSHEVLGLSKYSLGDLVEAKKQFEEALQIFGIYGDRRNIANTLVNLARIDLIQGDISKAEKRLAKSLSISRRYSIRWSLAYSLLAMGSVQKRKGNYTTANSLLKESLRISVEQGNQHGIANCLKVFTGLSFKTDQLEKSVRLYAAAQKNSDMIGLKSAPLDQQEYDGFLNQLHNQLGSHAFERFWAEGTKTSIDQLIPELLN